MGEGQRNAVFLRAIRDAGFSCQHVDRSIAVEGAGPAPMWAAHCNAERQSWAIFIASDGTAHLLSCPEAAAAGHECGID
jgi:hypothetical protein